MLVVLYVGYTLWNFHYSGSAATTRAGLLVLVAVTYFLFRRLTTFAPLGFTHAALLLTGAIEALWGLAQLYGFTPSHHSRFELTGSFFNPGPYSGFSCCRITPDIILHAYGLSSRPGTGRELFWYFSSWYFPPR